ncbi:MAG: hypothetical protein OXN94_15250 [Chloroflexota bacterium]|nr:hypothetical protein [Chloroflexota bacterium]
MVRPYNLTRQLVQQFEDRNPADKALHDKMVKLVYEMLDLHRQLAGVSLIKRTGK